MAEEKFELQEVPPPKEKSAAPSGYIHVNSYPDASAYGYGYSEEVGGLNLVWIWRAIWKRKWLIAVIAIIVTTVIAIQVFRIKSIYRASSTVEIGKENRSLIRSGDLYIQTDDSSDLYYVALSMKTKIRIIESRPLLEAVVRRLKLDQNPKFLDVTQEKSVWEAVKTISGKFGINSGGGEQTAAVDTVSAVQGSGSSASESERLDPYVDVLASNLSAEPLEDTRMLVISYTHTDPTIAASVANTIAEVFINSDFERKTENFTGASEWLTRTTRELEARVQQAEQELADYSRANNIFSVEGRETLTTDKLSRLHDQATRAETDRILKQSLYEEVKAGRVAQLPDAFSDAKMTALQTRLGELATQAAELDVTYGPKNPKVVAVREQMSAIQKQIDDSRGTLEEKLKADYERAVRDETLLKAALERSKNEAVQQNQAAIQHNIYKQKVDTAKSLYTDFLHKTNQAKIQAADQHNNNKLIDPARVPASPIGPQRMRSIMIWLFLSLAVGAGLALGLDYLDNTIKTVEDVGRYAQLPALSVIPAISKRRMGKRRAIAANGSDSSADLQRMVRFEDRSSVAEAYRVLRTSVLLSVAGSAPKTILVTSGRPGEGKTTTTVNTAISLAQLGASVLIIDCDLRKPATHKIFGLDPSVGLSSYLSGGAEIDDLILELQIPNLSLLPCGRIPPNPSELISSAKMKETLAMLSERYDHILIDSPPLMNVTDPVILSTMVDGTILVVHGGKSTRQVVRRARQELASVGAKIFGIVLNNVDLKRDLYDEYYYGRYNSDYVQSDVTLEKD